MSKDSIDEAKNRIFTVPNLISIIRLCLVPVFFVLLVQGYNIAATVFFVIAAGTDWIDGQIARRTHAVSRLGQLLDPAVDRILMIFGVLGLFIVGHLPLWIIVIVVARDLLMLLGGAHLLKHYKIRIAVIYPGKVATTLLFIGFAALLLYWPELPGLNLLSFNFLPGFGPQSYSWGIWFVYLGLIFSLATTVYYIHAALKEVRRVKQERNTEAS